MHKIKSQKGQTIIIIAFGIVALIGFTALAIDGGRVFSDRRHAQNAADTSALAAALSRIRGEDYVAAGEARAQSNGYVDDADSTVDVYVCTDANATCELPVGVNKADYVQVQITSIVPTTFARILGRDKVTNKVNAVARAVLPKVTTWFDGDAMVSTMTGCGGGGTPNPFTVGGNGTTIVNKSGIFVNSSCKPAFYDNGNSNIVTTASGVCVVGGIQAGVNGVTPPPEGGCGTQKSLDDYYHPDPSAYCATAGTITDTGGNNYVATPGYYNKTGNQTFPDVSPSGTLKLQKGIYCLYNGISLNGNWNITTDTNGNGKYDSDSEGVLFYVPSGDVSFNGSSTLTVDALSSGFPSSLLHYLFVVPESNDAEVKITGNNGSTYTGTIFAPKSNCTVDGSGNSFSLDTQLICYTNTITGDGTINITFNAANNGSTTTKSIMELTQ